MAAVPVDENSFSGEPVITFPGVFQQWPADAERGNAIILLEQLTEEAQFAQVQLRTRFEIAGHTRLWLLPAPELPHGTFRVNGVLFFRDGELRPCYRVQPIVNFDPQYFEIGPRLIGGRPDASECEARQNAIYSRMQIGTHDAVDCGEWRDVTFVCRDALISTACRIGPAELRPLFSHGIDDLASALTDAAILLGFHELPKDEIYAQINRAPDRRSPLFLLRFPRVYFHGRTAVLDLMPHVRHIFGILCLNRSSYASVLGGVYLGKKPGTSEYHYFNLNSYYRGNLATGPIANEIPARWEREYRRIERDATASDIVFKLNAAHAETDLDTAYFRLWAILEAVATTTKKSKHFSVIRSLVEEAHRPQSVQDAVKLDFHGERFDFLQLTLLWMTWRDLAAHHGGIVAYRSGLVPRERQEPALRRYLETFARHGVPFEYGEDYALLTLQDVARVVVRAYLDGRIATV